MPVPSSITDLSTTAGSNSPSGSESPITADDYLRTISAFVATLRDGKGQSAEATVASASTADIGAASSPFVQITGTTGITSFGTTYSGARYVRFAGALTLTHNATTLILPAATNITTAAGDTLVAVPTGNPGAGWRVVVYQRADGTALVSPSLSAYMTKAANLSDVANAATARSNLGLVIGTDVLAPSGSGAALTEVGPRLGTSVTAAGTAINFVGIPATAKRISVMLAGVSTAGTFNVGVQVGSGSYSTTGYNGAQSQLNGATGSSANTSTMIPADNAAGAANLRSGRITLTHMGGNLWVWDGIVALAGSSVVEMTAGNIQLAGALDRVQLMLNGADTFDAGTVNISWE